MFEILSVVCFDAKFNFDDSAKFRQKEVFAMDDQSESDPREVEAGKYDLNYIGLDGNIACLGKKTLWGWQINLWIITNVNADQDPKRFQ